MVDSNTPVAAGTYALNLTMGTPPATDICNDTSTLYTASTSLGMETLARFANDYNSGPGTCAYDTGPDRALTASAFRRVSA